MTKSPDLPADDRDHDVIDEAAQLFDGRFSQRVKARQLLRDHFAACRDEARREERDRCSAIADSIRAEAIRDRDGSDDNATAAACWADCAATILHEIRNG